MGKLYCFTSESYYDNSQERRCFYKLEANYQPLKAIANEILRFLSNNDELQFYSDNFEIKIKEHQHQEDLLLSIKSHPTYSKALIINVSTELRNKWHSITWSIWEPILKLIQKHGNIGYFHKEENVEDSDFRIDINENTLSKSPYLMQLGINNYTEHYPDIKPYHIELWYYFFSLSVITKPESFDENQLIQILEQSINLKKQIGKEKHNLDLLSDPNMLSQEIERAYLKSSFDEFESDILSNNNEFCFHSHNFGELHVRYELESVSIKLPYLILENDAYELGKFKILSIDSIQSLLLFLFKLGFFTNSENYAHFNTLILTLHARLTDGIWPKEKSERKDILKSYYEIIPKQQKERWRKGILDKDMRDLLNKALSDVKTKNEDYNYSRSNLIEILYDGINLLMKHECDSEKWEVLDISTVKTSLDLYDLVYIEFMSKHGINLSRFLLIQIIERVSVENNLSSYDLLMEYEAIVSVRSKTEKHQAIIAKWEKENDDDDYEEDGQNGFYSNDFLRKSYNEYYGHPDAEGWVDTSDY